MNPTYLIGIDGATFHILDHLAAEGHVPNLKALMSSGTRAELLSTPQPLTPPAWTTLMTGRTPGNHGIFDFIWAEERGDQAFFTLNNFRDIRVETLWSLVSRSGGVVTALNFPLTAPPPVVSGSIVPGLVSWKHLRRNVQPPALYQEMKKLPGFDPREMAWDFEREKRATKHVPEEEREDWIRFHIRRDRHWFELYRYLRRERPSDLTAILLDGTDKLQHICWPALDPDEAKNSSPGRENERRICIEYFSQLDRFIGEVVEAAEPDARIFVASDHGFGPTRMVFRLNRWLEEKGYLTWGETSGLSDVERERIDKMVQNHFVYLDWGKTKAYAQSAATNGIHIRVARKPGEVGVSPAEYESFRDRLIEELLGTRDPESGEPVVQAVLKKEEAFPGLHNDRCPDLTVILNDHGFISTLNTDPVVWKRPEVSGTHRPEGILVASGRGVRAGARAPMQSILDVAPTLLYSLGLDVPSDFEGSVMRELFEPGFLAGREVRVGAPTSLDAVASKGKLADAEEEELILSRLRALGYVN
jgi:predicted AlkP superfamily phosphohydrolase/phosphomutase